MKKVKFIVAISLMTFVLTLNLNSIGKSNLEITESPILDGSWDCPTRCALTDCGNYQPMFESGGMFCCALWNPFFTFADCSWYIGE